MSTHSSSHRPSPPTHLEPLDFLHHKALDQATPRSRQQGWLPGHVHVAGPQHGEGQLADVPPESLGPEIELVVAQGLHMSVWVGGDLTLA